MDYEDKSYLCINKLTKPNKKSINEKISIGLCQLANLLKPEKNLA